MKESTFLPTDVPDLDETTLAYAKQMDQFDPLRALRDAFLFPTQANGDPMLYFCGNSLGLQPKHVNTYIQEELQDWHRYGVEGHLDARRPWLSYHELFAPRLAPIVGAHEQEVVAMNTLSVNLHLMMVSFYRPTKERYKIVIEKDAFPSDKYAVASQLRFHGYDAQDGLIELAPRSGEITLRTEDIVDTLRQHGSEIALVLIGGVNYYTGQLFDMATITEVGHDIGAFVGFDLAHAVGNVDLALHDWNVDFAVWCHYKYMNAGPGAIAGAFIHERHLGKSDMPRFEGWWGHDKSTRFLMDDTFVPIPTAEAWQLSNAPVFSMVPLLASLDIFEKATAQQYHLKRFYLVRYLEHLVQQLDTERVRIITPSEPGERGCQLSIQVQGGNKTLHTQLTKRGVVADWREPDVIRVAPVPLYNSFVDVHALVEHLKALL